MSAVAVSGQIAWVGTWVHRACIATGWPEIILLAVIGTGATALLALRHPLLVIPFGCVVRSPTPKLAMTIRNDVLPTLGALLAWLVGAPTGVLLRHLRAPKRRPTGPPAAG